MKQNVHSLLCVKMDLTPKIWGQQLQSSLRKLVVHPLEIANLCSWLFRPESGLPLRVYYCKKNRQGPSKQKRVQRFACSSRPTAVRKERTLCRRFQIWGGKAENQRPPWLHKGIPLPQSSMGRRKESSEPGQVELTSINSECARLKSSVCTTTAQSPSFWWATASIWQTHVNFTTVLYVRRWFQTHACTYVGWGEG